MVMDVVSLPRRVLAAIDEQDDATERLIGFVQTAVIAVLGSLYALAPKTFTAEAPIVPVPWALASYMCFTLIRLVASFRTRLPEWFLALSILIDTTLLMTLIWSFHVQYLQPAAFYLKSPTILYAFIFITLRALRFEPKYVLASGVAAAAGWLALLCYALLEDPTRVTRDYVEYMTMNKILIGAEFDKVVAIGLVTLILALAVKRARALLVRAVSDGAAIEQYARFLESDAAARIRDSELPLSAGKGQARPAAVVCVDIRGFTRMSAALTPDEAMLFLTAYYARIVPVITAHNGRIDKFLGDGILVTCSASAAGAGYAADAFRMVDALMDLLEAWNDERRIQGDALLRVGASVAAGTVVFGVVGGAQRLEYSVIGDAVNMAAKIEKHNKSTETRALASADSYRLAVSQGYRPAVALQKLAGSRIEGLATPVDLVVLRR